MNIGKERLTRIFLKLNIPLEDISYFRSGKCGDLFWYHGYLLKVSSILDRYISMDKLQQLYENKFSFQNYLQKSNFYVPYIQEWHSGKLVEIVEVDGFLYYAYVMEQLDGESFPSNCLHEDDVKKISIFISEFVSVASLYPSVNKEYLHWINITPKHYEKLPKNILGKVNELRSSIESESVKKQFIHYDMNIGNLLVNNRIGLIDFDTVCIGDKNADIAGFLYSIWNVNFLLGICADEYYFKTVTEKMFETMSLEVVDIKRIDLFMQYRRLFLFTVFYEAIKNSNSEYYKMMVDSINNNTSFLGDLYE